MKILIIEDEQALSKSIAAYLAAENYTCEIAADCKTALNRIEAFDYDCILLDISLPDGNGLQVLQALKENQKTEGVIIISARDSIDDRIKGLQLGADDYLVKPFDFRELLARIRVFLKRAGAEMTQNSRYKLVIADLEIDRERKEVWRGGKKIPLTAKEYQLLELLALHKGKVISKLMIAEKVWNIDFDTGTNVIEVYMNFLRKKIDKDHEQKLLHTKTGMGYYLSEE